MITALRNIAVMLILAVSMTTPAQVQASTSRYFLDWSGEQWGNSAKAHGVLTVDDALFSNFSDYTLLFPGNEITDFSLTVSGAISGNGIFQLSDFDSFIWSTRVDQDNPLDLSHELIGQATTGGPWGSDFGFEANAGDFNLITAEGSSAPFADGAFLVVTNSGSGDRMNLTSFRPVPIPAAIWLFGSALAGLLGFGHKRHQT